MALFGLGDPLPREQRERIDALSAEFESLRAAEGQRLDRYRVYREENEASRNIDDLKLALDDTDYGIARRSSSGAAERHFISLPFGQALTVKHAYRIAGRFPDAHVDRREETPQERYRSDTMEKMWWGILHQSEGETMLSSAAWHGSQLGSSVLEVKFDIEKQMPYVCAVDPAGVLVVRGVNKVHDFQRVFQFWQVPLVEAQAEYRDQEFGGAPVAVGDLQSTHKIGTTEMVTLVQMTDKRTRVRFALGGTSNRRGEAVPLMEWQHGLGFVPMAVIPNIGPYDDVWGWADYEFYRALVAYIPRLLSREADILRMVANGAYQESGTGQDPALIKKTLAEGGIIPTKRESEIKPVPAPDVPAFQSEHGDRVMELLKMLSFAPDAAWGGADTRSGADRSLQLQPLMEFTAMKQQNWSTGLAKIASMCFRTIESLQLGSATYRGARVSNATRQRGAFQPFKIGPNEQPAQQKPPVDPFLDDGMVMEDDEGEPILLPRSPRELFDGDYTVRFAWANRIDPDDPAYVLSELNKFQQGIQSLRSTLERLGHTSPEDEMRLIEQEAERFPWLRSGLIALTKLQVEQAQNAQGGGTGDPAQDQQGDLSAALDMTQTKDGSALDADAGAAALGGLGQLYGGA